MTNKQKIFRTQVGIVGGGPAGLMLSHLLGQSGIESTVVEKRTRHEIQQTNRAGMLEHNSVRMLVDLGVSDRVLREGVRHEGISLRFNGESHRIDFEELVGQSVWLYPQTDVFMDLADARERDGGDVRFSATATGVSDMTTSTPRIHFTDAEGEAREIECEILVGADGSEAGCKWAIPDQYRADYFHRYPFAWFGILTEAPPSAAELIYTNSDRGFALISQRTETMQRMYFQCDPNEKPENWNDDRIWAELRGRMAGNGFELKEGPILEKTVLLFSSYVCEPMRYGRMFLAGDGAHTVPPTGAKGLNLALADVKILHEAIESYFRTKSDRLLDGYSARALERVWKAQTFSFWMTTMLHRAPDASDFEKRRQLADLHSVVSSRRRSAYLAEAYTGWQL